MDKISSILPGNSRVTSVDLKDSAPARPGMPAFGRQQGVSSLAKQRFDIDTSKSAIQAHDQLADWRTKDSTQAGVVQEITDRFFVGNKLEAAAPAPMERVAVERMAAPKVESRPSGAEMDFQSNRNEIDEEEEAPIRLPDTPEYYPKGSFIDYRA